MAASASGGQASAADETSTGDGFKARDLRIFELYCLNLIYV